MAAQQKIELGDEVKCTVTGFKGIATARTQYLNGCDRIGIQPPVKKDGKWLEALHIDEPQIVIVKKGKVVTNVERGQKTGGPSTKSPLK